jgi:hypothetical protein
MFSLWTNGQRRAKTCENENAARHDAVKAMGNVFVMRTLIQNDTTSEVVFAIEKSITVNRRKEG